MIKMLILIAILPLDTLLLAEAQKRDGDSIVVDRLVVTDRISTNDYYKYYVSDDYKRYAYIYMTDIVTTNLSWNKRKIKLKRIVIDGKLEKECLFITNGIFSANGMHFAYVCYFIDKSGKRISKLVLDGRTVKSGSNIRDVNFSKDSNHIAYVISNNNASHFAIDNKEVEIIGGRSYSTPINAISLSPNARVWGVKCADKQGKECLMVNRKKYYFDEVTNIKSSLDSKHFVFIAKQKDKYYVYLNGENIKGPIGYISLDNIQFSKKGKRLLVKYSDGTKKYFVVELDTKRKKEYQTGNYDVHHDYHVPSKDDKKSVHEEILTIRSKSIGTFRGIYETYFSPYGKKFVHITYKKLILHLFIEGKPVNGFTIDNNDTETIAFSVDNKKVAFVGRDTKTGKKYIVVVESDEIMKYAVAQYKYISDLDFSPDSKNIVAMVVSDKSNDQRILFNGRKGRAHREIQGHPNQKTKIYIFEGNNTILYYAKKKASNGVYFVKETFR